MLSRRHFLYALLSQYAEEALQPRMVIVYICQCDLESNSKSKVGVRQASFWYSTFSSFHVVEEKRNLEMAFFKRSRARSRRLLNALDLLTFLKQNEVVYKSDLSQEHDFYRVFQQVWIGSATFTEKNVFRSKKLLFQPFLRTAKMKMDFKATFLQFQTIY